MGTARYRTPGRLPVVLGSGKRLFGDGGGTATTLRLVQAAPVGSDGVVILTYQPARDGK